VDSLIPEWAVETSSDDKEHNSRVSKQTQPACDLQPISHALCQRRDSMQAGIHTQLPVQLRQSECVWRNLFTQTHASSLISTPLQLRHKAASDAFLDKACLEWRVHNIFNHPPCNSQFRYPRVSCAANLHSKVPSCFPLRVWTDRRQLKHLCSSLPKDTRKQTDNSQ